MPPSNYAQNRLRQLKGLVTIDAWHELQSESSTANLHAYVYFDTARLGGESGDEIAFRLELRNAEIRLLQSEPRSYRIDPKMIWRGDMDDFGKITVKKTNSSSKKSKKSINLSANRSGANIEADLKNDSENCSSIETTLERVSRPISVVFQRHIKEQPTWVLRPVIQADSSIVLKGQPWDDKLQQLIAMNIDKVALEREMLSVLKLMVSCKREDLYFFDFKKRNKSGEFVDMKLKSPQVIVMQEYLRKTLISEGLSGGDMNSPFSVVVLGEVISELRKISENE